MYIAKRPKFLKVSILVMKLPQGTKTLNRGGYRVFQKGGLRPAIRNVGGGGGGGVLSASGPIRKAGGGGGGGAVHLRPDTKSGGGGGGGCCPALQARYKMRGRGGGGGGAV